MQEKLPRRLLFISDAGRIRATKIAQITSEITKITNVKQFEQKTEIEKLEECRDQATNESQLRITCRRNQKR